MAKGNMFIKRKVMACSISLLIVLVGVISLLTLPVEQYPDIAPPTIRVSTTYTGADANTVMNSVIMPLETAINGVENMYYMTSQASSNGEVNISVFFNQGTDPDMACVNVQNRVSAALGLLPAEVTQIGVTTEKSQNSILQISAVVSRDDKFNADLIANYIDIYLKPKLLRVTGVGNVNNLGNTYSLRIWMKPDAMARYGLEPADVTMALQSQNLVAATGSLGEQSDNAYQYNLEYKGRLKSIEEFEDIVLKAKTGGQVLLLRDVADIELGAISYSFTSKVDNHPGVIFMVNQAPGANATKVNAEINKVYEELSQTMPSGLEFTTLMSSDDFLYAAIHNVVETLIIAILLVILVVFFFLQDFKATLIPSISICVSLLGTFAIVKLAGFSLNILTLFALVLAIGTVVDDSIVVVEAVMAKLESGYTNSHRATRDAMSDVSVAVVSCTLVFMAVFIPITFMPGTSGTFFTQFGITIASSVGLSCISAMTMCPALAALLMKPKGAKAEGKGITYYTKKAYEASYSALLKKYKNGVTKYLKHPKASWGILVVAMVLLVYFMVTLPTGLVPQEDQGRVLIDVTCAPGTTLHQTDEILQKIEGRLKGIEEVESYAHVSGYGIISGSGFNNGMLILCLKDWDERKGAEHSIDMVMYKVMLACEDIKEASIMPFQTPQIPGYGNGNAIELQMEDLESGDMATFTASVAHKRSFLERLVNNVDRKLAGLTN